MTTVIQTNTPLSGSTAVREIYTQLGIPTMSLFGDTFSNLEDGEFIPLPLVYDGLDLVSSGGSGKSTNIKLRKDSFGNSLKFTGSINATTVNKKAFDTTNNFTLVANLQLVSTTEGTSLANRIFSLGAATDSRFMLHTANTNSVILHIDSAGDVLVIDASKGFKANAFNKIAIHCNKIETIVVCNGITTLLPPYLINFDNSYTIKRGVVEFDLDFLQVFENKTKYTAAELIGYLDYMTGYTA